MNNMSNDNMDAQDKDILKQFEELQIKLKRNERELRLQNALIKQMKESNPKYVNSFQKIKAEQYVVKLQKEIEELKETTNKMVKFKDILGDDVPKAFWAPKKLELLQKNK